MISRMELPRCLPPGFSLGSRGSKIFRSASLKSLGYGLRCIVIARCIMPRGYHDGELFTITPCLTAF